MHAGSSYPNLERAKFDKFRGKSFFQVKSRKIPSFQSDKERVGDKKNILYEENILSSVLQSLKLVCCSLVTAGKV